MPPRFFDSIQRVASEQDFGGGAVFVEEDVDGVAAIEVLGEVEVGFDLGTGGVGGAVEPDQIGLGKWGGSEEVRCGRDECDVEDGAGAVGVRIRQCIFGRIVLGAGSGGCRGDGERDERHHRVVASSTELTIPKGIERSLRIARVRRDVVVEMSTHRGMVTRVERGWKCCADVKTRNGDSCPALSNSGEERIEVREGTCRLSCVTRLRTKGGTITLTCRRVPWECCCGLRLQ